MYNKYTYAGRMKKVPRIEIKLLLEFEIEF